MSTLCSNYETVDEFDPQLDFAQFLKKAKTHACQHKSVTVTSSLVASSVEARISTKSKKSWKTCIISWLKADKKHIKSNSVDESFTKSKSIKGYASGPINGGTLGRPKRTTSGPITGRFIQRKTTGEEFQMPYISLGQLNRSQSYGPVYLVT